MAFVGPGMELFTEVPVQINNKIVAQAAQYSTQIVRMN